MEIQTAILVHIHRHLHGMEFSCDSLPRMFGIHYYFFSVICHVLYISVKPSMTYTYQDDDNTVILQQFFCSVPKNIYLFYVSFSGVIYYRMVCLVIEIEHY